MDPLVCLSVCLCLCLYLSVHLLVCSLSVCLCLPACPSTFMSVCFMSVCLSVLFVLLVCVWFVCCCVCLQVWRTYIFHCAVCIDIHTNDKCMSICLYVYLLAYKTEELLYFCCFLLFF
jgi:hypothetical protein